MSQFHVWSTCQKCQPLTFATRTCLSSTHPGWRKSWFLCDRSCWSAWGMGWNSWSGANVLSCIQGLSAMQNLTRLLRLSQKSCAYRKCRADCGSKTEFFDLGYRTRAPIRRDREKVEYLESKRQESCQGICLILHLTSVNTKDIETISI